MSFNFGTPKPAIGFALPTTTPSNSGFQFSGAAGDAKTIKPSITLTFTPTSITTSNASAPSGFNLTATTTAVSTPPQFNLSTLGSAATTASSALSFSLSTTTAPSLLNISTPSVSATPAAPTSSVFSLTGNTLSKQSTLPTSVVTTTVSTTSTSSAGLTTTTPSIGAGLGGTNAISFGQLEDLINKWTIYLEDEGKHFSNQAKQVNAWDRLLVSNSEKVMILSEGIERVKHLQDQLDQELEFVATQQKELLDLIVPLEEEITESPVIDVDRHRTYQMAESLDTELKQMSEDLKEIIEHLNEATRIQEFANPMFQIGCIMNVHMNSLQWIDRQVIKITTHIDQISKMHDLYKRNHEINLQKTYE